ncbi:hypothetical protein OENI_10229 [Oenococcus oeni]|nr:hypothetical protein OENI_10229 [Oenococcus oeni]SYW12274.1 hypothetical protein OENI_20247 [Oenococcus oeni]
MINFIFPVSFNKKWRFLDLNDSDKEDLKYLIANYVKNVPLNIAMLHLIQVREKAAVTE